MRAAILPTLGNPLQLAYWFKHYDKFFSEEFDRLYVCVSTFLEPEVIEYLRELVHSRGEKFVYIPTIIQHGEAINLLLDLVEEDHVVLLEDDFFIFKEGELDKNFELIENGAYAMVGTSRGCCSDELRSRSDELWKAPLPGFWPCYFFCRRETLVKTDRMFSAKGWNPGTYIPILDYTTKNLCASDTFVHTSMQLRAQRLSTLEVYHYHGGCYDYENYKRNEHLWDGKAGHVHTGSLSSGLTELILDDQGHPMISRKTSPYQREIPTYDYGTRREIARRAFWLRRFSQQFDRSQLVDFVQTYDRGLKRLTEKLEITELELSNLEEAYSSLYSL